MGKFQIPNPNFQTCPAIGEKFQWKNSKSQIPNSKPVQQWRDSKEEIINPKSSIPNHQS
jgi:hypothetical protein